MLTQKMEREKGRKTREKKKEERRNEDRDGRCTGVKESVRDRKGEREMRRKGLGEGEGEGRGWEEKRGEGRAEGGKTTLTNPTPNTNKTPRARGYRHDMCVMLNIHVIYFSSSSWASLLARVSSPRPATLILWALLSCPWSCKLSQWTAARSWTAATSEGICHGLQYSDAINGLWFRGSVLYKVVAYTASVEASLIFKPTVWARRHWRTPDGHDIECEGVIPFSTFVFELRIICIRRMMAYSVSLDMSLMELYLIFRSLQMDSWLVNKWGWTYMIIYLYMYTWLSIYTCTHDFSSSSTHLVKFYSHVCI